MRIVIPGTAQEPEIEFGSDELGSFARLKIAGSVFSETAVLKTAYWFTDSVYVFISRLAPEQLHVELREKGNCRPGALREVCGQFANALLDNEVRQRVIAETSVVRDTLVKKAFFEARRAVPENIASDESRTSRPGQTAKDNPVGARRSS